MLGSALHGFQVVNPVITLVVILVMNDLISLKRPYERLENMPVKIDSPPVNANPDIRLAPLSSPVVRRLFQ